MLHSLIIMYYTYTISCMLCFIPPLGMSVIVVSVGVAIASYVLFVTTAI